MTTTHGEAVRILLVEDDVGHIELIRRAFETRPQVHMAVVHTLRQARACLADMQPHLIIADLRLPDGNGNALIAADRDAAAYPVVIMTSHGDEQVAVEAMKAGALDYVVKSEATLTDVPRIAERALREWGHIVERRHAEEAARQAQADLLAQQQRQTEHIEHELKKAKRKLIRQTRLATIGQVAASIAHELRNPLGAVRNANYFLQRRVPPGDAKWHEYLGIIEREISTAERIIRSLLEMTRIKEPAVQPIDLHHAVQQAFARVDAPAAVVLRCTLATDPYTVVADPEQLQQVFVNLLTNAVQALDGTGHITVTAQFDPDFDTIIVHDDGPGIAEEVRGEIFEPLFTTKAKGTGLGLAICRQFIERHGGTLDLAEPEGPGAAFRLRLPRSPRNATASTSYGTPPSEAPPSHE